jgi:hypothetical protein
LFLDYASNGRLPNCAAPTMSQLSFRFLLSYCRLSLSDCCFHIVVSLFQIVAFTLSYLSFRLLLSYCRISLSCPILDRMPSLTSYMQQVSVPDYRSASMWLYRMQHPLPLPSSFLTIPPPSSRCDRLSARHRESQPSPFLASISGLQERILPHSIS